MRFAREFGRGFGFFTSGLKGWLTKPKVLLLGALPALITSALMFLLLWWALPSTYGWSTALTGFAEGWALALREGVRITLALAMAAGIVALCVLTFVNITLFVGGPFYEQIAKHTDRVRGGIPNEVRIGFGRQVMRGAGDAWRLLQYSLTTASYAFLVGLIPVLGPPLAAVVVLVRATHGLAMEVTAFAGDARGWSFEARKRRLREHSFLAFGAAFPSYLAFLVPGLAVIVMPAAVVAGTLLVRELDD